MSAVRSTGPERTIPVISNDEEICIMVGYTPTNFIFSDEVGVHLFGGQLAFIVVDGNHRTYGLRQLRTRAVGCMRRFRLIKTLSDEMRRYRALTINRNRNCTVPLVFWSTFFRGAFAGAQQRWRTE